MKFGKSFDSGDNVLSKIKIPSCKEQGNIKGRERHLVTSSVWSENNVLNAAKHICKPSSLRSEKYFNDAIIIVKRKQLEYWTVYLQD
jgi:hypothetical protein